MKKALFFLTFLSVSTGILTAQESKTTQLGEWFINNNFSIQQTFDGSRNENKPASIYFKENHLNSNDFVNIDLGLKASEIDLFKRKRTMLLFYPKVEYHKSTENTNPINKIEAGINMEFVPLGARIPGLPEGPPNGALIVAPYLIGTSSIKRNYISREYETEFGLQITFSSAYRFLPGSKIRDKNENLRFRYYPYFGIEYQKSPNTSASGNSLEFTNYLIRMYLECWILPQKLQINIDGSYRHIFQNKTYLHTGLPMVTVALFYYPGNQEIISLGLEYKQGYELSNSFIYGQSSGLKLSFKL